MNFRARLPENVPPAAWFVVGAVVLWCAPTIVLHRARLTAARARFGAEMLAVDALVVAGCRRAARRLLARVILRNRRLLRAERDRATKSRR